jgi:hypothetical protein
MKLTPHHWRWLRRSLVAALMVGSAHCTTVKPYEKEFLLNPLMETETANGLAPKLQIPVLARYEHLGGARSAGGGQACPTCGG